MNAAVCVGGGDRSLIDARFLRSLSDRERLRLESHLVACSFCSERYRRMQLAERVASVGPEQAFDEPSPFEIERIAGDLGLSTPEASSSVWSRWFPGMRSLVLVASTAVAAAAVGMFVITSQPTEDRLVDRGATEQGIGFAAYVLDASGAVRTHAKETPVHKSEYLKLRVSAGAEAHAALSAIAVVLVHGEEIAGIVRLTAPPLARAPVSIPGAIPFANLPDGRSTAFVIGTSAELDQPTLRRVVEKAKDAEAVSRAIGVEGAAVERFELEVVAE